MFQAAYRIIPELHVIVEYFSGTLEHEPFMAYKKELVADENYNPDFNYLDDFRDMDCRANIEEIMEFLTLHANKYKSHKRKLSQITSTPQQVTVMMIFDLLKEAGIGHSKVFTTFSSALSWIDIPDQHQSTIKLVIEELKTNIKIFA